MTDNEQRDRITRLEEQVKYMRAEIDSLNKKGWTVIFVVLAFVGNKLLALIGGHIP